MNPKVIVELSSPSTEASDRSDKLADYRRLLSLTEYVVVSQQARRIEVYRRDGKRWVLEEYGPGETAQLESLGIGIEVDAVYFDPLADAPGT